jgi:hypothetical protein
MRTASMMANIAADEPMPTVSVTTTDVAKSGARQRERTA